MRRAEPPAADRPCASDAVRSPADHRGRMGPMPTRRRGCPPACRRPPSCCTARFGIVLSSLAGAALRSGESRGAEPPPTVTRYDLARQPCLDPGHARGRQGTGAGAGAGATGSIPLSDRKRSLSVVSTSVESGPSVSRQVSRVFMKRKKSAACGLAP